MITIDCISDLHGYKPPLLGGDLLIVAGDLTARDTEPEYQQFIHWLNNQQYRKKIVIAGNHDGELQQNPGLLKFADCDYLCDSGTEFEGYKIWGSPWTPEFYNWHFMKKRGAELKEVWDKIPIDTDILVTHGPPYGILDKVEISSRGDKFKLAGCEELRIAVERVKPKFHIFGHIHENGGQSLTLKHPGFGDENNTIMINASLMNEDYHPIFKPHRVYTG